MLSASSAAGRGQEVACACTASGMPQNSTVVCMCFGTEPYIMITPQASPLDRRGNTPLSDARASGDAVLAALLERAGGLPAGDDALAAKWERQQARLTACAVLVTLPYIPYPTCSAHACTWASRRASLHLRCLPETNPGMSVTCQQVAVQLALQESLVL